MIMLIIEFLASALGVFLGIAVIINVPIFLTRALMLVVKEVKYGLDFKPEETEDDRRKKLGY